MSEAVPTMDDQGGLKEASRPRDRLDAAERTLPRRRFFSDMPDKGLFGAVAFLGFLGIIVLKTYFITNAETVAALAVIIMLAYGFASFQMPIVQIRPDRLGDNFYYLGFIFTLASLSSALVQLRSSPQIEELLGNFGIALVTTVVGVAGRVLFVQMRGDIDDIEERVRRDLAAASADLRAQLVLSLREFETFHTGVLQAVGETATKAAQQLEERVGRVGHVAESAVNKVERAIEVSDARIDKLGQLLERVAKALDELPMMSEVELPSERLENQIMAFTSELELLVMELRGTVSNAAKRQRWWLWPSEPGK